MSWWEVLKIKILSIASGTMSDFLKLGFSFSNQPNKLVLKQEFGYNKTDICINLQVVLICRYNCKRNNEKWCGGGWGVNQIYRPHVYIWIKKIK